MSTFIPDLIKELTKQPQLEALVLELLLMQLSSFYDKMEM